MSEPGASPGSGPSRRVVAVSDPASEAAAYARRLGADVVADRDALRAQVEGRIAAARVLHDEPADEDADDLLGRASAIRSVATAAPATDDDLERLHRLAAEVARAGRIRAHTERRFEERAAARRAAASGVNAPLEVLREAAAVVAEAETRRDRAAAAVAAADLPALPFEPTAPAAGRPRGGGLLARLRSSLEATGVSAPASREPAETASTPSAETAEPADGEALAAALAEAEVKVALALEQWHRLAGPHADPHAPDVVARAGDPQLRLDAAADPGADPAADPAASPTVAAVAAFHRKAQARWRVLWASVGGGEPPEPEQLDLALEGLAGRRRRAAADLVRLERAERRAAADAVLARPLVVVEPARWAPGSGLDPLLAPLPPGTQVIVLDRRSGGGEAGPRPDGP